MACVAAAGDSGGNAAGSSSSSGHGFGLPDNAFGRQLLTPDGKYRIDGSEIGLLGSGAHGVVRIAQNVLTLACKLHHHSNMSVCGAPVGPAASNTTAVQQAEGDVVCSGGQVSSWPQLHAVVMRGYQQPCVHGSEGSAVSSFFDATVMMPVA